MKPIVVCLVAIVLGGCKSNAGHSSDAGPTATAPKRAPGPDEEAGPIACKSDADCPRRACGPCKPGEIVKRELTRTECYRNPCTNSRSVCNPQGVCAVHPDTRFTDDVKSAECQKLMRDKWGVLCKGKSGSALADCEAVVDSATAKDDDAACKSARARLGG